MHVWVHSHMFDISFPVFPMNCLMIGSFFHSFKVISFICNAEVMHTIVADAMWNMDQEFFVSRGKSKLINAMRSVSVQ